MSAISVWKSSPVLLQGKSLKQIIGILGNGKLADGNETSKEFFALLSEVPSELLAKFADECLTESFPDSGFALQDIINEVGRRLGFKVTNGFYRGRAGAIGNDGLWELPNQHKVVVEVKTTDAYRIDLKVLGAYRTALLKSGTLAEEASSMLVVVGRNDTGDLEAQVRGSQFAWEMRLISVDALVRLVRLKESVEDPDAQRRIYEILIPREFTKLDEIVELVFSTAEDAVETPETFAAEEVESEKNIHGERKFTPVAFNNQIAENVSGSLGIVLLKRSRVLYSTPDDSIRALCVASKEYDSDTRPGYWFAFHPHQKEQLERATKGYAAFGCGSPERIVCIPIGDMKSWFDGMNRTEVDGRYYWHIQIHMEEGKLTLVRKRGQPKIDLNTYLVKPLTKSSVVGV